MTTKKRIKSWSFSRLQVFEQCKRHAKLKFIDRIPEPERPLPPGKTEHANDRGSRIHKACEDYITHAVETLTPELDCFAEELKALRDIYVNPDPNAATVTVEGEWGFDENFLPREYKGAWLLMKADITVQHVPEAITIIDLKTGRKSGNEIKHARQINLYAGGAFARNLALEEVVVELWYCDQNDKTSKTITRDNALRNQAEWLKKGQQITSTTVFPPNPTLWTCRYCPYNKNGTGDCEVGVVDPQQQQKFHARRKK